MRPVLFAALAVVTTAGATIGNLVLVDGCGASPQQVDTTITDGVKLAGCVLPLILSGLTDPATLLTCANATEALIIDVIDDFTAQKALPDGGLMSTAQMQGVTPQGYANLQTARSNCVAALAAKQRSK